MLKDVRFLNVMVVALFVCLVMVLIQPYSASAEDLSFRWDAPATTPDGYHLFMDGHDNIVADIDGSATTVSYSSPDDGKLHAFWIKAYIGEQISGNSDVAVAEREPLDGVAGFTVTTVTTVNPN